MKQQFNLTTVNGMKDAIKSFPKDDAMLMATGPFGYLAKKLFERYGDDIAAAIKKAFNSAESMIREQKETAIDIIKAGKASGAESIEIVLDQKAGIDIGSSIEGAQIKAMIGKKGHMILKVKYKEDPPPAPKSSIWLPPGA